MRRLVYAKDLSVPSPKIVSQLRARRDSLDRSDVDRLVKSKNLMSSPMPLGLWCRMLGPTKLIWRYGRSGAPRITSSPCWSDTPTPYPPMLYPGILLPLSARCMGDCHPRWHYRSKRGSAGCPPTSWSALWSAFLWSGAPLVPMAWESIGWLDAWVQVAGVIPGSSRGLDGLGWWILKGWRSWGSQKSWSELLSSP